MYHINIVALLSGMSAKRLGGMKGVLKKKGVNQKSVKIKVADDDGCCLKKGLKRQSVEKPRSSMGVRVLQRMAVSNGGANGPQNKRAHVSIMFLQIGHSARALQHASADKGGRSFFIRGRSGNQKGGPCLFASKSHQTKLRPWRPHRGFAY